MGAQIKAIAGLFAGGAGGVASLGTIVATIFPAGVTVPWWGYLIAFGIAGGFSYLGVYNAPKNAP